MTISPSGRWLPALTLTIIFTAAAASAAAGAPPVSQAAPSAATLLRPARVWTAGEPVHEGWVVLIRGSRIVAVGAAGTARAEAGARVIELPGATLLPGLMDAHSHLFLHPYDETRWDDQVLKEPVPY
ncbi:MAG: amidohydrolase family protein, partial [Gammaproteobacteria bacterium]